MDSKHARIPLNVIVVQIIQVCSNASKKIKKFNSGDLGDQAIKPLQLIHRFAKFTCTIELRVFHSDLEHRPIEIIFGDDEEISPTFSKIFSSKLLSQAVFC